ncbi:MAG: T9SS C-terminal target domain-containing protein, partial [Calditrichaeota bacterium]
NSAVQSLEYASGGNLFAATSGDLFRIKQNEENWETLQTNFRQGEFSSSLFVADNDDVFASTNTGALFRSVDHGDTWEQVIDDSPGPSTVNCLFKDYNNYLFAGTDKGMLRSQFPIIDVAQPLIEIESDSLYFETAESLDTLVIFNKGDGTLAIEQIEPTSYYAYRVEAIHNDSSFIWYVYKNHNIYESLENKLTILPGDSASLIFTTADLCPVCKVSSINRFFSDTLLVYTNDYTNYPVSIFASGQGMPSSVENDEQIKRKSPEFHLYPNYPNPFNPSTKIPFVLDKPAFVELTIYDVTGRIVVQLLQERRPAGQQTVLWHAQGMNSGVYFCKLQAGNQVQSIKLLLVK